MIINSIIFIVFVLILLRCEVAVERCTVFLYLGIIANVSQICDGRVPQHKCSFEDTNFLPTHAYFQSPKARLSQMCC